MYNPFGDYIKRKRKESGLSLRDFGEKIDLSHTYIDSIEKGIDFRTGKRNRLTNEAIQKIATYLHQNPATMFLLSLDSTAERFPFYYDANERERIKPDMYAICDSSAVSLSKKYDAVVTLFKMYFSRSLEVSKFNINHVSFEEYAAMLLNQQHWKKRIEQKVYNALVKTYGTKIGIKEGGTYYVVPEGEGNYEDNNFTPEKHIVNAASLPPGYDKLPEADKARAAAYIQALLDQQQDTEN